MKESEKRLLIEAANELGKLIAEKNLTLIANMQSSDMEPPKLHVFETCWRLEELAKTIEIDKG